ncbi:MAG: choice-of-anchor Q domain-containing protein [Candidatus Cloacimonadota bacterium]|nr:choice-of-anchor Q domain-containing protein [Candidatus Cloacimonadota bacterium]
MLKRLILSSLFILLFFSFSLLFSDTIIVDTTGTGNYITIQQGINAAANGDTVLVYPGTYFENINYNGKNITVASLYLTTQNNSYIDSTIIDGNQNGSVVTFNSSEDSTAVLSGFTITNGTGTVDLFNTYCGGGIFCKNSNPRIMNCVIKDNSAYKGGGIFFRGAEVFLNETVVRDNTGGGIHCWQSIITLNNVNIFYNHYQYGGAGIAFAFQSMGIFNSFYRCNIYLNFGSHSSDLNASFDCPLFDVFLDTATVISNVKDFIYFNNAEQPTIDILHGKIEPINQDLYVSPTGNDSNIGLTPDDPLKTISWALVNIASDSTHHNTIYLTDGIYSPETTGERFPLNMRKYVSLIGESEENTILDGNELSSLITCIFDDSDLEIKNLTIQNGNSQCGGGIYIAVDSNPIFKNITIKDNYTDVSGGGIHCYSNCNPIFENVTVTNNSAEVGGGVKIVESNPIFINCIISYNSADPTYIGTAGISCTNESSSILINTLLIKNSGNETAGIFLGTNCYSTSVNNSFVDNNGNNTIYLRENGNIELVNSILWDNTNKEIYFYHNYDPNYAEISYTDIKNGESGINTNGNGTYYWGPGNINQAPLFVDSLNDNYQLLQGSPCIDAGTPDTTGLNLPLTDLAGNPRIYNGRIDIGAYEWQGGPGIDEPDTSFINKLYLFQNKPNPFSSSTTITFISADYERLKDYKLSIYNARGQLIRTYNGKRDNFWVKTDIVWDGTDEDGKKVSPGMYFYKLEYGFNAITRKMLLVK